ncbi:MAG: hypothetical protein KatS3mg022_1341 [Armatimonadota bacterium]|nr:MAG: hypothetical protein KatS3mg022_1341 [Armatimonadota bacterium]
MAVGVALFEGLYSAAEGKPASVVVRDAVVSGALTYVGARFLPPVESAAAQVLTRQTARQAAREAGELLGQRALPPRILLTQRRLEHIVQRHWPTSGTSVFEQPAGKFLPGMTAMRLREMLRIAGERGVWQPARGMRLQVEYNFGQVIGVDRYGRPATRLRMILDPNGEVVTAYPY